MKSLQMFVLLAIGIVLAACTNTKVNVGTLHQPSSGLKPSNLMQAMSDAGCVMARVSNGLQISCNGTSGVIYDGINGTNGSDGAAGAAGPQGIQGIPGTNTYLTATQNDGSSMGGMIYVGEDRTGYFEAFYDKGSGLIFAYYRNNGIPSVNGTMASSGPLYYTTTNCTGDVYIATKQFIYQNNVVLGWDKISYYKASGPSTTSLTFGAMQEDASGCTTSFTQPDSNGATPVVAITLPSNVPSSIKVPVKLVLQ